MSAKNVTILGLLWVAFALHIVGPAELLRYYLLFAGIHRLLAWAVHDNPHLFTM